MLQGKLVKESCKKSIRVGSQIKYVSGSKISGTNSDHGIRTSINQNTKGWPWNLIRRSETLKPSQHNLPVKGIL